MPALSDTMNNGRLSKWLKQPGDKITTGEAIAEVETDKAIMEVEAFHDGYLAGPLAAVNAELPVGQTIGFIADTAAEASAAAPPAAKKEAQARATAPAKEAAVASVATAAPAAAAASAPVSPILAAAIAHRPRGRSAPSRTVAAEVARPAAGAAAPSKPAASSPPYRLERLSPLRDSVARNMIASAAAPTFHVTAQLSLTPLMNWAKDKKLSFVTQTNVGHWCQGVTFNKNAKKVLVQCMIENEIMVFDFDGKKLKKSASLKANGPAGIRIAD